MRTIVFLRRSTISFVSDRLCCHGDMVVATYVCTLVFLGWFAISFVSAR